MKKLVSILMILIMVIVLSNIKVVSADNLEPSKITIADLVSSYIKDRVKADELYKGKNIQINGTIQNVEIKYGKMYLSFLPEGSLLQETVAIDMKVTNAPFKKWQDFGEPKVINLVDKSWVITFNKELVLDTVNIANVYVCTDSAGNNLVKNVKVKLSDNKKQIIVNPENAELWEMGKTYYLFISDDIKDIDGKNLTSPLRMKFSLKR